MGYTVIDKKTENHTYGALFVKEKVSTTISLVYLSNGNFGISYESKFSGVKDGHVQGGPVEITGNMNKVVNKSPKVTISISNFHKSDEIVAMTIKITVDIPVIGSETIYNQTLSGPYNSASGWETIAASLQKEHENQTKATMA